MRERLPDRHPCETFEFEHRGTVFTASIGLYPDGRIAEAFIDGPKAGTDLQIAAKDSAVAVSIALQHGASIDDAAACHGPRRQRQTAGCHRGAARPDGGSRA